MGVELFTGESPYTFDADVMLEKAKEVDLDKVIILGIDRDGNPYLSSNNLTSAEVLWIIECAKRMLFEDEE
jgi:hypothetical protein